MLKRTALYEEHVKLGGRMVDFGGWELPVQYSGTIDEHNACRAAAGLFDVSHMGEVFVDGPDAEAYLDRLVTQNIPKMKDGQCVYTVMCLEDGGIVDDLVIYRRSATSYLVVVNASNTEKDFAWMRRIHDQGRFRCALKNVSAEFTQIAIQGRHAQEILSPHTDIDLKSIAYYRFREGQVMGVPAIVSRTGYTGEDGFEVYLPWSEGPRLWRALMETGAPLGLKPCGLGARDTLRLEMKFALYGNELSEKTHPLEAGLGWVVKLEKTDFVGKAELVRKKASMDRALVGLRVLGPGIARHGYKVWSGDGSQAWGEITSGTQSPSLKVSIAIAYVPASASEVGARHLVEIRGQKVEAQVVETPFYKRPY